MTPTRVLVVSDTHLRDGARLPDAVLRLADEADRVVHAGDLTRLDVLVVLEALAPVTAVHGNVCDAEVVARLPERAVVEVAGVRIGVVHDPGPAAGRAERLRSWFADADVVVFGHTHAPVVERADRLGLLLLNPGSPTQRRRAPTHTVAWLELEAGEVVAAELVDLPGGSVA